MASVLRSFSSQVSFNSAMIFSDSYGRKTTVKVANSLIIKYSMSRKDSKKQMMPFENLRQNLIR